jgi:hypothetical protein
LEWLFILERHFAIYIPLSSYEILNITHSHSTYAIIVAAIEAFLNAIYTSILHKKQKEVNAFANKSKMQINNHSKTIEWLSCRAGTPIPASFVLSIIRVEERRRWFFASLWQPAFFAAKAAFGDTALQRL